MLANRSGLESVSILLECPHRRHQTLGGQLVKNNPRRSGKLITIQRQDGFKRAPFTVSDHRPPARLRLQRHYAKVLFSWEDQRLACSVERRKRLTAHPPQKFDVRLGHLLERFTHRPLSGYFQGKF